MKGYPKFLNTREDYEFVRDNFDRSEWEKDFQYLLDTRCDWFFVSWLSDGDEGVTDATNKVVEMKSEVDGQDVVTRAQYVLQENPDCKLNRLGFSKEEIEGILGL